VVRIAFLTFVVVGLMCGENRAQNSEYTASQALSMLDKELRGVFQFPLDGTATGTDPNYWMSLTFVGLDLPDDEKEAQKVINQIAVFCPPADQKLGSFDSGHRLDQVYDVIMTQTAVSRPKITIDGIDEARKVLRKEVNGKLRPTDEFKEYNTYRNAVNDATTIMVEAQADGSATDAQLLLLARKKRKAEEDLRNFGYKQEMEEALSKMMSQDAIDAENSMLWRREILLNYRDLTNPLSALARPRSYFIPSPKNWLNSDRGWSKVSIDTETTHSTLDESHYKKSGYASASGGGFFWKAKVNASHSSSTDQIDKVDEVKSLSISLEVKRVLIDRPWLDNRLFFEPGFWTWIAPDGTDPNSEIPLVSKGILDGVPDRTNSKAKFTDYRIPIPVIPTEIIVAKSLKLKTSMSSDKFKEFKKSSKTTISGGGSGRFLFWKAGGKAGGSYSSNIKNVVDDGTTASFEFDLKGPVIIGVISAVVPKLPDPKVAQRVWAKNAWFSPGLSPSRDSDSDTPSLDVEQEDDNGNGIE